MTRIKLFRQQAIDAQRDRFLGAPVFLPIPSRAMIGLMLLSIGLLALSFACWGYYTDKLEVEGTLVGTSNPSSPAEKSQLELRLSVPQHLVATLLLGQTVTVHYESKSHRIGIDAIGQLTTIHSETPLPAEHSKAEPSRAMTVQARFHQPLPQSLLVLPPGTSLKVAVWQERKRLITLVPGISSLLGSHHNDVAQER